MVRIVSGNVKGRRLKSPPGSVRPTTSRVRTSLFDALARWIPGRSVLDLCAGTGSLGIEALSRGASCAIFVDTDYRAAQAISTNLGQFTSDGRAQVWQADATDAISYLGDLGYTLDLILADPPYDTEMPNIIIEAISRSGVLSGDGILIIEHSSRYESFSQETEFSRYKARKYGSSALSFFRSDHVGSFVGEPLAAPLTLTPMKGKRRR